MIKMNNLVLQPESRMVYFFFVSLHLKTAGRRTGLVYVFNLIVGTGALTLPAVFNQAGWALGVSLIMVLAVISFITVTFVIESMAAANAIVQWKRLQQMKRALQASESQDEDSEDTPLFSPELLEKFPSTPHRYYLIQERIEMGQMATLFFSRFGCSLFFVCFAVYLYGDLTIYSAAVSKSLVDIACTYHPSDLPCNSTVPDNVFCWEGSRITRLDAYRVFLAVFLCTLGPFVFFNVQKTKYLQMLTTLMRWLEGCHYHWCIRKMVFPLLAVIPPVLIATTTENLEILVRVTGSYAGASIQYIIPALLVYYARQKTLQVIGMGVKNEFASPFHGCGWVWFVILWAIACSILVTVNFVQRLIV